MIFVAWPAATAFRMFRRPELYFQATAFHTSRPKGDVMSEFSWNHETSDCKGKRTPSETCVLVIRDLSDTEMRDVVGGDTVPHTGTLYSEDPVPHTGTL